LKGPEVPILLILVFILGAVLVQRHFQRQQATRFQRLPRTMKPLPQQMKRKPMADSLRAGMASLLSERALSWKVTRPPGGVPVQWRVDVPSHVPIPTLHQDLQERIEGLGGRLLSAEGDPGTGEVTLQVGAGDSCLFRVVLARPKAEDTGTARLAVVIDDFGDRSNGIARAFLELDVPVTISILPGRRYSTRIARDAVERGREILLHLTLEPLDQPVRDDGYLIRNGMTRSQIQGVVDRALKEVPGVLGVNNHMGSKTTQDRATLTPLMQILDERGLFFMDSYTVASSIALPVARELGLRSARRDVFLDVTGSREGIRAKIGELARRARAQGSAIGIGHCHSAMLEVLREEIPRLQARGYRFVYVSELMH
jgi:polysaccharide deacetylase 2 family uncharacterized protein YibQ